MGELDTDRSRPSAGIRRFRSANRTGSLVELEDDSSWEVQPGQEIFTKHWSARARITVVPGSHDGYPYDLINSESGERVAAKYCGSTSPSTGWSLVDH